MGSRRYNERQLEVPNEDQMPRPLIAWGILAATVSSLRDNFKDAMKRLDIDGLVVDITHPLRVISYPAILVRLSNITVKASGMHSVGNYPMDYMTNAVRDFVLLSEGTIGLEIWSDSLMEVISIQDHITQLYLMSYLYEDSFYYPGTNREYIGIGLQPGALSWSEVQIQDHHDQPEVPDNLYTVSCSFDFRADHSVPFELARISAIDVEAIPDQSLISELPPLSAQLP